MWFSKPQAISHMLFVKKLVRHHRITASKPPFSPKKHLNSSPYRVWYKLDNKNLCIVIFANSISNIYKIKNLETINVSRFSGAAERIRTPYQLNY